MVVVVVVTVGAGGGMYSMLVVSGRIASVTVLMVTCPTVTVLRVRNSIIVVAFVVARVVDVVVCICSERFKW